MSISHFSKTEQRFGLGLPDARWLHKGALTTPEPRGTVVPLVLNLNFMLGLNTFFPPKKKNIYQTFSTFCIWQISLLLFESLWCPETKALTFLCVISKCNSLPQSLTSRFDLQRHNLFPARRAAGSELCCHRTAKLKGKESIALFSTSLANYPDESCERPLENIV